MAELALLVNSTDTALLNSSAVSSGVPNGGAADTAAGGGFATVLGKQLMSGGGATGSESPPPVAETRNVSVAETGEAHPIDGKALPPVATESEAQADTEFTALDASLMSAITLSIPAVSERAPNTLLTSGLTAMLDPTLIKQDAMFQRALPQAVLPNAQGNAESPNQSANRGAAPISLLNTMAAPPGTASPSIDSGLAKITQEAQQATMSPAIPSMLGKSISTTAERALQRASLQADKMAYLRPGLTASTAANTQNQPLSPDALPGMQSLLGGTPRLDLFNAVMGGMAQAGNRTEPRLPTVSATPPGSLIGTATLPDTAVNLSADAPRIPGTAGNGLLSPLTVSTPVGQPAWASELGQRVTWLANSELREAQLQLHPRSLGAVEVRIAYGHEQQIHVSFSAANPIARDALEASLPRLREMFEQQGLNLADANISQQSPREQQRDNSMTNESTRTNDYVGAGEAMDVDSVQPPTRQWLSEGMLNAYA